MTFIAPNELSILSVKELFQEACLQLVLNDTDVLDEAHLVWTVECYLSITLIFAEKPVLTIKGLLGNDLLELAGGHAHLLLQRLQDAKLDE